jgi:hypothetical protein
MRVLRWFECRPVLSTPSLLALCVLSWAGVGGIGWYQVVQRVVVPAGHFVTRLLARRPSRARALRPHS